MTDKYSHPEGTLVFLDIETNFPPDKLFKDLGQLAVTNITHFIADLAYPTFEYTHSYWFYEEDKWDTIRDEPIQDALLKSLEMTTKPIFIGHNICRFDAPVLKRLWGIDLWKYGECIDTLLMSKVLDPTRKNHSLESYYTEFGMEKLALGVDMLKRCKQDVEVTRKVFYKLMGIAKKDKVPFEVFRLESRVAEIISRSHQKGVVFDKEEALKLIDKIDKEANAIREDLTKIMVPVPVADRHMPPKNQFKKDGTPSAAMYKYCNQYGYEITNEPWGRWMAYKDKSTFYNLPFKSPLDPCERPLNPNSSVEIKKYLMDKGWKPTIWNVNKTTKKRTSPKLYDTNGDLCPNLADLISTGAVDPGVARIADYLHLSSRRNVLCSKSGTGFLMNSRVHDDGRLCPDADTVGAVTGRFTHKIIANIPRVTSPLGKEIRSLFKPSKGRVLVGWDASSLEARMEAHYTYDYDGGKYAAELTEGDVHTKNMLSVGLSTRDAAKTWKYAITYGAGAAKIATTFGMSLGEAEDKLKQFWDANPALANLVQRVQHVADKHKRVRAIDGRFIPVENSYSALNRLLQSAGAITMKYAMVLADRMIRKEGLDAEGLIRYHDEEQWECNPEHAEKLGKIGVRSIELAGKYLKLKVPLTGEFKIGNNWAETH